MKQLSLVVAQIPPMLTRVSRLMADHNINIDDIEAESVGEMGVIVMSVDRYDLALQVLRDAGLKAISEESLLVRLNDAPGALARLSQRFQQADIPIRGLHIVRREGGDSLVAISVQRSEQVLQLLGDQLVA